VNSREWSEEAKEIRDPQNDTKNNHSVQDRLNTRLHRDEAVDNPKQNPDYDERDNKLHERHLMFLFSILGLIEIGRRFRSAKTGWSCFPRLLVARGSVGNYGGMICLSNGSHETQSRLRGRDSAGKDAAERTITPIDCARGVSILFDHGAI
jgi:hypothetical protein